MIRLESVRRHVEQTSMSEVLIRESDSFFTFLRHRSPSLSTSYLSKTAADFFRSIIQGRIDNHMASNNMLQGKAQIIRVTVRVALTLAISAFVSASAFAQYPVGGGTGGTGSTGGYVPPKGGYSSGKAIGIGVGAAAGGAGVLFLALHHHGAITGCVQKTDDGFRLVDDKNNKSYDVDPGSVALNPGDRVQLKGKRTKNDGVQSFQATRVVKTLGSCSAPPSATPAAGK